jgi:hypothetical protein
VVICQPENLRFNKNATCCAEYLNKLIPNEVGGIDRLIRYGLGMTLIAMTLTGFIGAWGWVGLVPLATAVFGSCAVYSLLGMRTCKTA